MIKELTKKTKNDLEKDFFKLRNNAVFGKTAGIVRKHRDIKLVTKKTRRISLASELNLPPIEMKKIQIFLNKPVYLGLIILELSKIVMHEFWYD